MHVQGKLEDRLSATALADCQAYKESAMEIVYEEINEASNFEINDFV